MHRNADFSPQGPGTDPRVWSLRPRATTPRSCGLKSAFRTRCLRAFSLPELMMAMTILVLVLGGGAASHFFGMRLIEITNVKGSASEAAQRSLSTLMADVASAKLVAVGNGTLSSFAPAGADAPQQGSALQIYPSTDTNIFVRYYRDSEDKVLKRVTNGTEVAELVASAISNADLFTLEDFAGHVLSHRPNNCTVGLLLQFERVPGANVPVGPSCLYTSYQVRSRISPRAF